MEVSFGELELKNTWDMCVAIEDKGCREMLQFLEKISLLKEILVRVAPGAMHEAVIIRNHICRQVA